MIKQLQGSILQACLYGYFHPFALSIMGKKFQTVVLICSKIGALTNWKIQNSLKSNFVKNQFSILFIDSFSKHKH